MMGNYVELKVCNIFNTIHPAGACAMVLQEVNGARKMPVIIGYEEAKTIKLAMSELPSLRPLMHDLFVEMVRRMNVSLEKALIYKAEDGVFYSRLYFCGTEEEIVLESRTSDAVALAMRFGRPLYTTEEIIQLEQLCDMGEGMFSVPISSASLQMLEGALKIAIEREEYEQASKIRDEISKRKGKETTE